jgi:DNA-binding NarL/FixJ family response regulator
MLQAMTAPAPTKVVIVDDHPLFRQGLRQVIEADARFELCGEADTGEAALQLIQEKHPSVAVLDINLPAMSGLDVATAIQERRMRVQVVILTMFKDEQAFNQAMNVGVQGYVLKENAATEILGCIGSVARGEPYVSPVLTSYLLRRRQRADVLATKQPCLDDLTTAERRVLRAVAQKKSTKEIASEFSISPRTVESHRANICGKLHLQGSNALLQYAIEHRDELSQLT